MSAFEPRESYRRVFFSESSRALMLNGRIIGPADTAQSVIEKLTRRLAACEANLGEAPGETRKIISAFAQYVEDGVCILGSPLLTNVAAERPTLASCTAIPLDAGEISLGALRMAEDYYKLNMGSGYNLDGFADPVDALLVLNRHANRLENAAACERYIGNIAHVAVDHPAVCAFIEAKTTHHGLKHFNISVDITDDFMNAVASDRDCVLRNGQHVSAATLWQAIVSNAWACGDPGLISLDRFNADNPVAAISPYTTTAPCAEVGLAQGEACVFGYINLAACLRWRGGTLDLDLDMVGDIAECLTRILDDSVENSLSNFPTLASNNVMASNRKIGIGICGFADALLWIGLDYGSDESCALLRSALSTINFRSKHASMVLAARRGAFLRFPASRYSAEAGYVARFAQYSAGIGEQDWRILAGEVARHGLRNAMTTALPPSGRTSLLLGVNASIEPMLGNGALGSSMPERVLMATGYIRAVGPAREFEVSGPVGGARWPRRAKSARSLFRTATRLSVAEHISVLAAACRLVDDGVSKTVNLSSSATAGDVEAAFTEAWEAGLKAISVYREPGPNVQTTDWRAAG
jgi:ribonucleoside-diphosphate reductase alpha chain